MTRDGRTGLDVLSYDECLGLLAHSPIGRVAVLLAEHPPAIFPINYAFDEHNIVFRTDTSSILHRVGAGNLSGHPEQAFRAASSDPSRCRPSALSSPVAPTNEPDHYGGEYPEQFDPWAHPPRSREVPSASATG
jgi:hypothetical protein